MQHSQTVIWATLFLSIILNYLSESYLKDDKQNNRFQKFLFPRKDDYHEMGWTLKKIAITIIICGFIIALVVE